LVFAAFDVRIDLLDFGGDLWIGIFELDEGVLGHLAGHVVAKDLAVHT
jgi:hypothetical protein